MQGAAILAGSGLILEDSDWLMQQSKESLKAAERKRDSHKARRGENKETVLLAEENPTIADHNPERPQRKKRNAHRTEPYLRDWELLPWEGARFDLEACCNQTVLEDTRTICEERKEGLSQQDLNREIIPTSIPV